MLLNPSLQQQEPGEAESPAGSAADPGAPGGLPAELHSGPGGGCPDGSDASQLLHRFRGCPAGVPRSEAKSEQWLHGHGEQAGVIGQFHCRVREMFSQLADLETMSQMAWVLSAETLMAQSQIEDAAVP